MKLITIIPAVACLLMVTPLYAADKPVKVFILAGQSNMEGKAPNELFDHQAVDPKTRDFFAHLRKDDKWIVRDDVFIKFLDRKGPLTIGYGSPGRTGAELEFGTMMGDHFDEPVVLIKAAWGGHSLYKNFRPPSAGYPAAEVLQKEVDQAQASVKRDNEKNQKNDPLPTMEEIKKPYGSSYRNMMLEVKDVMDNYAEVFPSLKGKTLELAGFVWFQGWNDQYGAQDEYASNMQHFIRDVRQDLQTPKLPFVIAAMGQNGSKPATGAMLTIQQAQLAMNDVPEFKGNVKAIRTDVLVDKAAEELYPTWEKNVEQWKGVGGDHGYHYLGSAIWYTRIGHAMAEAMLELMNPAATLPALVWRKGAPSPFARVESPTAVVDGKMYLFGGFVTGLGASNEVDAYDPASDSWKRLKDMPTRVTHLNPAIDRGTIWLAGGFKGKHPGPVTDEVWKYDIASDTWTSGPPLPEPRGGGGLAAVGGKLHYFGGYKADRDTNAPDHWSLTLDGGTAWQREADLPDPRGHVASAVLDGKIYALGGAHGHDKTQIDVKSCHRFDPATGKWSEIASLPDGRSHFEGSAIVHNGRIYIVGGRCNSSQPARNVVDDLLEYDPKTDAWRVVGTMPEKVLAPAAAFISGNIVVSSGGLNNPQPLTDATWIAPLPPGE